MTYFRLYNSCVITKGANRSLLLDFERGALEFLPNELSSLVTKLADKVSFEEITKNYSKKNVKILQSYLEHLISNEYGFYLDYCEWERFLDYETKFRTPKKISNAIIEIDGCKNYINDILNELQDVGCNNIHLISYQKLNPKELLEILKFFTDSIFASVELTFRYSEEYSIEFMEKLSRDFFRITEITLHNSNEDLTYPLSKRLLFRLNFSKKIIKSFNSCGKVDPKYFNYNPTKFLEAQSFNSCLNCKLSIDINGNIKNCPAINESFGNILDVNIKDVIQNPNHKKLWNISKDDIDVCKDCEFRYICTDCRAFIENPNDDYSKPLKCGYNPYTNKWEEWSENPLKQEAIKYYDLY